MDAEVHNLLQDDPFNILSTSGFHPYDDTIFLSKHNTELIVKYHFGTQKSTNRDSLKLVYPASTSRFVFPFLRCEVPFV